jgi:hypothetical protein
MRRNVLSRPFTAILAVWFALTTVGSTLVHSCPMHDDPVARVHSSEHASASGLQVTGHAGHQVAPPTDEDEQGPTCCTCMDDCSGPPAAWMPLSDSVAPVFVASALDRGLPDYAYVPVAAAHVLPFANGPPIRA